MQQGNFIGVFLARDSVVTKKGLRQGDSLACLLFNLALEKVVRKAGIQTSGTIFYKCVQLLAYADDIDIIARSQTTLKEAYHLKEQLEKWA